MKPFILVVVVFALLGCSKTDDISKSVIEQQRVNLDTLKQNQETLENIHQKDKELSRREQEIRDSLRLAESKEKALSVRENRIADQLRDISTRESNLNKLLAENTKICNDIKLQNSIATKRSELAAKRIPFLEELIVDWCRASSGNASHLEMPEPLKTKMWEELNRTQIAPSASSRIIDTYRDKVRGELPGKMRDYLQQSNVLDIELDEQFEKIARETVERFMQQNCGDSVGFNAIKMEYRRIQSEKKRNIANEVIGK